MSVLPRLVSAAALLAVSACSLPRLHPYCVAPDLPVPGRMARHDYSNYAKYPDVPTDAIYRAVEKAIPCTRNRAFWGNWGGNGCSGGRPIDAMDDIFRHHDIAYAESDTFRNMRWADAACVEALRRLDPQSLTPAASAFRQLAISFFSTPAFALIGKPWRIFAHRREPRDAPFHSENEMRAFFGLNTASPKLPSSPG